MRHCPNVDCGYAQKFGRPGEYQDSAVTCSDCGAALSDGGPPALAKPAPMAKLADVKPSDANRRLAVTIGAGVALLVLSSLPLLGRPTSVFGDGSGVPEMKMLAVGMTPFTSAFSLVEIIALMVPALRLKRVGGKHARASLDRAAWTLGFVLLVFQLFAVDRWARSAGAEFGELMPPAGLMWLQYALAHGAMLGLAFLVSRAGLGHGLGLVMLMTLVQGLAEGGRSLLGAVESEAVSPAAVLLIAVLIGFVVTRGVRFARQSRPTATALPKAVPFPVSGAAAWISAGAVLALPATLATWLPEAMVLQRALQSSSTFYLFLSAFIAFDLALVLGFLFFRPQVIGGIWKRWNPSVDETGAISAARALLPRALMLSVGFTVGVPLLFASLGNMLNLFVGASTVLFALIIACAIADMVDEWHALRKLGPLVSVWEVQRTAEVEPIASLLGTVGIELHARSFLLRTTQQFFAPWIPVSILVPQARAEEAKALLAKT